MSTISYQKTSNTTDEVIQKAELKKELEKILKDINGDLLLDNYDERKLNSLLKLIKDKVIECPLELSKTGILTHNIQRRLLIHEKANSIVNNEVDCYCVNSDVMSNNVDLVSLKIGELNDFRRKVLAKKITISSDDLMLLEMVIKKKILSKYKNSEILNYSKLYFQDKYPTDLLGTLNEVQSKGIEKGKAVATYITTNSYGNLYSLTRVKIFDKKIENEKNKKVKKAKNNIQIDLDYALSNGNESDLRTIRELDLTYYPPYSSKELSSRRGVEKIGKVLDVPFGFTVTKYNNICFLYQEFKNYQYIKTTDNQKEFKKELEEKPQNTVFLKVHATSNSNFAEVIHLSIINGEGRVLYNNYFTPSQEINGYASKFHRLGKNILKEQAIWNNEWSKIKNCLENKNIIIPDTGDTAKFIIQTCLINKLDYNIDGIFCPIKPFIELHYDSFKSVNGAQKYRDIEHCFKMLSFLMPKAPIFDKQQKAQEVFSNYCEVGKLNGVKNAEDKAWAWLRKKMNLHDRVNSFKMLGIDECEFVLEKLKDFKDKKVSN